MASGIMKKIATGFMIAVLGIVILFLAAPRNQIDMQLKTISLPENLDRYLSLSINRIHLGNLI